MHLIARVSMNGLLVEGSIGCELPNGWALRLPNDDEMLLSLARWSVGERRCCPFFAFAIEREPDPGALWVRITGPEGAKEVLAGLA
jgi:hypothetical protein